MKLLKLMAAVVAATALMAASASADEAYGPNSRYVQAVHHGYCPVGLICPSYDKGVKPAISTPGHMAHIPKDAAPPVRKAQPGDTLWWIAEYYIGVGRAWHDLCWFPRGTRANATKRDPRQLRVGDFVAFC